jgi:hypothetical protein
VGRLSRQVKTPQSNLAKNAQEPKGTPGRIEEGSRTDEKAQTNLYEPTITSVAPAGHVNHFQDVKIISF